MFKEKYKKSLRILEHDIEMIKKKGEKLRFG